MKTALVIGLGRFGKHLAINMAALGNEVMVVDIREDRVNELLPYVTRAQIGDCMDESVMQSLGVRNFDICFVCMGDDFQASLVISSLLSEMGAKYVVSKADRSIHEKFLLRNGADEVIHPERDVALRAARKYSAANVFDFIDLTDDFSIFEIDVPESWVGKSIKQVNVRIKYNINIIAIKDGEHVAPVINAEHVFERGEHLIVGGDPASCEKLLFVR